MELGDARSDLYSLGCVFYRCLTGQPVFPDADPEEWGVILDLLRGQLERNPGFWREIAKHMKGGVTGSEVPSIVTCSSCITSSKAACVLAGARLISSAKRRLVNTGPFLSLNSSIFESYIMCPQISLGMRSGVN